MLKETRFLLINLCLIILALGVSIIKADELKADEIVAKHLDSIGSKEKRDAVKNRLAAAKSEFVSKIPYGRLFGKALIVSEAPNLFFVSSFNSQNYPFEKIGFFDKKVSIPFVTAGNRSPLGGFLLDNNKIVSERLFTGSISAAWSLLDPANLKGKINAAGKKKLDGRETYVLEYIPKGVGSSDFSIKLFFDAETFRHVRSEYLYKIPARDVKSGILGTGLDNGRRQLLIETFGDYKEANGLILPHSYKIYLLLDASNGTNEYEWNLTIAQYLFNQKLDAGFFSFEEK